MSEPAPRLALPKAKRAKVMIWSDLTVAEMDRIDECVTPEQVKRELTSLLQLDGQDEMRNAVLLDLYFYTLQFCRDNKYSKEQTSTFFSIVKSVHEMATETPFENLDYCFAYFKELVLCHAVKRPPFSIDLFSAEEVRIITKYVINTYFRHYKMYKYVFTPLVRLDLSISYAGMPGTPPPEPNAEDEEQGQKEGAEDGTAETGEKMEDATQPEEKDPQENTEAKEVPAISKLRALIKEELNKEVKILKQAFEEQLKISEDTLTKKISAVEPTSPEKTRKGSAKARKK